MAKAAKPAANAVTTVDPNKGQLPAFMQADKTNKIGNVDSSDLIIPRVKLIQKISPEVDAFDDAEPGNFWHTIAEKSLGDSLQVVPILMRKSMMLWAPRSDDRGILARSNDCIHWDVPNQKFTVRPKGAAGEVVYDLKGSVAESGLAKFGSSIPGNSKSPPAASLTYNFLFYLPEYPEISPVAAINTRSGVQAGKDLLTKVGLRPGEHYGQIFRMSVTDEIGDEGPYHGYKYTADGYLDDEGLYKRLETMFHEFNTSTNWRVNEEGEDVPEPGGAKPEGKVDKSGKY